MERTKSESTEALIMAAQEQALNTRAIEAVVHLIRQEPRCRLCKEASETVQHIAAGCKMQAGTTYMERHNPVAGIVCRNICGEYRWEVSKSEWETPPKVVENDRSKILWDFQVQTNKLVMADQPCGGRQTTDEHSERSNIKKKEHEKLKKSQGLKEEMWPFGAVIPKLGKWGY